MHGRTTESMVHIGGRTEGMVVTLGIGRRTEGMVVTLGIGRHGGNIRHRKAWW